ncbi:putative ent-copalyl diphosphate synthase [Helianthus annuus]|nr:putative ent-copalyl diphosphate synthase [Helianthus annuus]
MNYPYICANVSRYWDDQGIGFARNCNVPDLDDTAMAFRVLRTNGYQISTDAFRHFNKDGQFMCYPGQSVETVTVMFNLYRASQALFPGDTILNDAKNFSHKFLTEKRLTNKLLDRWIITKDLTGEVEYVLDVPWMGNICNDKYLEMAKLDYNHCQAIHQMESRQLQEYTSASIFEPERRNERVAWAKTVVMLNIINSSFGRPQFTNVDMQEFADKFLNPQCYEKDRKPWHMVLNALHITLIEISLESLIAHGIDIHPRLHHFVSFSSTSSAKMLFFISSVFSLLYFYKCKWTSWLVNWQKTVDVVRGEAELIVQTIYMSSGRWLTNETLSHPQYQRISSVTNELCYQLSLKENRTIGYHNESKMQELVRLVLCDSPDDIDPDLKQMFLTVAKTFYYRAYVDPESINCHVHKVLFENVI